MIKAALICYDLPTVSNFFKSVAYVHALESHTRVEWVSYTESEVLNVIYAFGSLFGKAGPGTAEVRTSDPVAVQRRADELHARYLNAWSRKVMEGGAIAGMNYVAEMDRLRASARQTLSQLRADVTAINAGIETDTQKFINELAAVRLGATIGVAVIGASAGLAIAGAGIAAGGASVATGSLTAFGLPLGASGTAFTAASLGFSVTGDIIKNWDSGGMANAVAITSGKALAEDVIGGQAQGALVNAVATQARSTQIMEDAMRTFTNQSLRLAKGGLKKVPHQRVMKSIATSRATAIKHQAALHAAETVGKNAARTMRAVPIVFAGWDILNAVDEYRETVR